MTMLYDFGESIGEGRWKDYLSQDWNQTKSDLGEIASRLHNGFIMTSQIGALALSKSYYPITGNLSESVQGWMEDRYGKEKYNHRHAGISSILANFIAYPTAAYFATESLGGHDWMHGFAMLCSMGLAYAELLFRPYHKNDTMENLDFSVPPRGSMMGKIASLPLEMMMGIYEGRGRKDERVNKNEPTNEPPRTKVRGI